HPRSAAAARHRLRRCRTLPAPLAAALAAVALLLAPPARAADNGHWSVFPAASQPGSRPYFHLSADPGQTLRDEVTVTNRTAAPLTLRLYAADAHNTARDGGFAVRAPEERRRGVGAWARPERERVTVPARGSVTVPYTITVPDEAPPGDHPGALVALDERVAAAGTGTGLGVRQAVGARIYLRVNGPAVPALTVEDLRIDQDRPLVPGTGESSALVSYTLHNRGNVTLSPRVRITAGGLFGRRLLDRGATGVPSELLPRQRVRLTERWPGAPWADRGEVRVTAEAAAARDSAAISFLAVPWLPAGLLAVAAALLAARAALRRRAARRPDGTRAPQPKPSPL
ncbi:WxL protein peptidoglycan domain-containing protein, partial [Streptomyces clavuligerus]